MKKGFLFLLLVSSFTVNAQSLKDALFGGKLKNDSGVIRQGDDLSKKIDTSQKKPVEPVKKSEEFKSQESSHKIATPVDTSATVIVEKMDNNAAVKDNNRIWKEFVDIIVSTLKAEVLPNKKIKKGDYYVLVDYAIGIDGVVAINSVFLTPESKFLEEQIKERLTIDTPKLSPVTSGTGKARKVIKRYNFTISKD